VLQYPEFQGFPQNAPIGYLSNDQRQKLRAWVDYDFLLGPAGTLNLSALERFDSGAPYSAMATIPARANPSAPPDIAARYVNEPRSVTYYFGDRGAYRWENLTATDVSVNYRFPVARAQLFVDTRVFNVFNHQSLIAGNTTVVTANNATPACRNASGAAVRCAAFNPFTETPVLGVNYALPAAFGQSTGSKANYQTPRTYQVSLGVRF
jgi:hypothetical protein